MQKPHCDAPASRNASWIGVSLPSVGEALDGRDLLAVHERREIEAARHGGAVDQHRAAAAQPLRAALARAEQLEAVAQDFDDRLVLGDLRRYRLAVEGEIDGAHHLLQRLALRSAQRPVDLLGGQRQLGQPHAAGILDRIRNGRRHAESAALADALGAERAGDLLRFHRLVLHDTRNVDDARDLVVGERGVGDLAAVELDLLLHGEAVLHRRGARQLRLDDARIHRPADVGDVDHLGHLDVAGLGVDLELDAGAADHPERRRVGRQPVGVRRHIVRDVAAGADDVAGLHLVFLHEQLGDRHVRAFRHADLARQRGELGLGVLGREPHRVAHVIERARAERRHVVGRHVGVGMHDLHRLGRDVEHLGHELRIGGVGALPHVDGAAIERDAAVGRDIDDRDRGGRRDRRLEADGDAAALLHRAGAALERRLQFMRSARRSSTASMAASFMAVPVAWARPSRRMLLRRNSTGSSLSARAIMSVWLS